MRLIISPGREQGSCDFQGMEKTFNEIVREPGAALRYLANNDLLSACHPLTASDFVRFCSERGVDVTERRLEALERRGIVFPLLRVRYPKIKVKIEHVDDHRIRHHGMLKDGESWDGELREENSRLSWRPEWMRSWLEEGFIWDPREKPFESWSTWGGDGLRPEVQTFYSMFQIYPLRNALTLLTCNVWLEPLSAATQDDAITLGDDLAKAAAVAVEALKEGVRGASAGLLAQILSARYYFHTQGDHRTISVPSPDSDGWDWWQFSSSWDAKSVATNLGLVPETVKDMHRDVQFITSNADPLEDWYELVSFVALRKREKLKGAARFAQLGYAMEQMMRLFYRDLTGSMLPHPDEGWDWDRTQKYGAGVTDNALKHLEYLVNEYNLNPRPKVVLFVEGDGEAAELPKLALSLLGSDFGTAGIEIRALGSVDEFSGDRRLNPHGALARLVDDFHARQTIVFVILDNENTAKRTREALVNARSKIVPERLLTRPEYVHLWDRTFEFDNFSDDEIAEAMTEVAEGRYAFEPDEIARCRAEWDEKPRDHLSALYRAKLQYGLPKKGLASVLMKSVAMNAEIEAPANGDPKRPIVRLLQTVINLAVMNHQPESDEGWLLNQKTGYFGEYDAVESTPGGRVSGADLK